MLEAGCGTGQLSNFLGMSWKRRCFAGDICLNCLRLGKSFADRYTIRNGAFLQMNQFRRPLRDNTFDVVISNGVLHHTGNCEGGLRSILAKLKPGGLILIVSITLMLGCGSFGNDGHFARSVRNCISSTLGSETRAANLTESRPGSWTSIGIRKKPIIR